jgi:hypothetical protein
MNTRQQERRELLIRRRNRKSPPALRPEQIGSRIPRIPAQDEVEHALLFRGVGKDPDNPVTNTLQAMMIISSATSEMRREALECIRGRDMEAYQKWLPILGQRP